MALNFDELNELESEVQRHQKTPGEGGNVDFLKKFLKMPDGVGWVDVRLVPPDREKPLLAGGLVQPTRLLKLGENGINVRSYHSRRVLHNGRWVKPADGDDCPVTQHYHHLWNELEALEQQGYIKEAEAKKQLARSLKPIDRFYYNVIEIARSDADRVDSTEPKILSTGKTVHEVIVGAFVGNEKLGIPKYGDVTDFDTGRTLRIYKDMKGGFPDYGKTRFLEAGPIGDPEQRAKWIAARHDLSTLRRVLSAEELKEKLQIHLGIIKPTTKSSSGYNPEDFQIKAATEVSVSVVKAEKPVVQPPKETPAVRLDPTPTPAAPAKGNDECLVEEDFWDAVENMSKSGS